MFTTGARSLLPFGVGLEFASGPVNSTFKLIGAIWAAVGGFLFLLFLSLRGMRAVRGNGISEEFEGTTLVVSADANTIRQARGASEADVASALSKLAALSKDGLLSPDEWERAKELYLGKPESRREADARLLRELNDLHDNGVLSEYEFNTKKWEILSRT